MKNSVEKNYEIPRGLRVYAIGDVHGHAEVLDKMHDAISTDLLRDHPENAHIVYLGDYINRGPDSRGVIERLIARRDRGDGIPKSFLKGNHEGAVFEFMKAPLTHDWLRFGGIGTLAEYGVRFQDNVPLPAEKEAAAEKMKTAIPPEHWHFLQHLELSTSIGDYLFVHAGINPKKPLVEQTERELTAIREPFLSWHKDPDYVPLEKKVVHGHSVYEKPQNRPHRISVDTGLYQGGPLSCAVLEGADVRFLQV